MAPPISQDMQNRILAWHQDLHLRPKEIATLAGCSVRSVHYIISYYIDYGTAKNPFARTVGRTRSLNIGDMNYLVSWIAAHPKVYLDEL